jgi:hypothetical protein
LELPKIYSIKASLSQIDKLISELKEVEKMIYGLIKSLKPYPNS